MNPLKTKPQVVLRVEEPDPSHVGRNIITLDRKTKEDLSVTSGDIVEIIGSQRTAAVIWPARQEDEGKGIIRMDNLIRRNAGVGLGEKVTVQKADFSEAKRVVLAPTQEVRIIASGYDRILKKNFIGRPLNKGDRVLISVFGSGFIYQVIDTNPRGVVKVTDFTQFVLKEEPVKDALGGIPRIAYEDIGGLDEQVQKVREMIELPMRHPEVFRRLGISPPKGVLLYGPPGTGKTLLAKAVANETQAHFISISSPSIMSKFVGEAEERIREVFKEAEKNAPSIIFFDEIDAIAPKRDEVVGEVERRVVAQILSAMDGMEARGQVIVIGATNRVNSIDEALRRPGRFDREIEIGVPSKKGRLEILQIHTRGMPLSKDIELEYFAGITHGFVGADLEALAKEAAMKALRRYLPRINLDEETIPQEVLESLEVNRADFLEALKDVQPSALREVAIEVPNVKWADIGGLESIKDDLKQAVEWPLKHPENFQKMGIKPPRGILLYGPPGCGKTAIAKAIATESEANFISIKGPQLISMWVGESLPYDEELLVFDGKKIFREKIGRIVEEKLAVQVVTFDSDGKAIFSRIIGHIKHPLNGKMLEVTTKTGRSIKVTDKHSLFTLSDSEIESVATQELVAGKSVIAIPARMPNISLNYSEVNLFEHFKNQKGYVLSNVSQDLRLAKQKYGPDKVSSCLGLSKKYLADIIGKNLSVSTVAFANLLEQTGFTPDFSKITIGVRGARNHVNVLLKIDSAFCRLLGLYVAEGDFDGDIVRITNANPEIRSDLIRTLDSLGLGGATVTETNIIVNACIFKHVLEKVFGLKTGAENKSVPGFLFAASSGQVQNFLKGYFSGDGSITLSERRYVIEATTVSRKLANDLLYLFLKMGIVASCKEKPEWSGSISSRVQVFGVENFRKFLPIGFIDSRRNLLVGKYIEEKVWTRSNTIPINHKITEVLESAFGSYPKNNSVGIRKLKEALCTVDLGREKYASLWKLAESDIYWDRVKEIKEISHAGPVYDISVEPCQNFVAGFGGIFAHNSEKGIRKVFQRARQVSPVVVFFDEIDSIASRRGASNDSGVNERMVNQLLTELDGIEELKGVVFVAATNRPDLIDPALLRPGRIDKILKVPAPDFESRKVILKIHSRKVPLAKNVTLDELAAMTEGYSGADLEGLIREAALAALQEANFKIAEVKLSHFEAAMKKVTPTITKETVDAYDAFKNTVAQAFKPSYVR
ncbi:MAG TPA: CDC48 family AAA ATPase [Candidatus Diapherotrites archaeon]|uniref:CDC48 family AAA ATPase n=1 Tax=Candidatus Iainarchaeum sp. TaxID=3101447 RepID=A0A7J4IY94_9ARCH|nr:CDC48 family AAA ATPase [Candidatus Diapherotrites archaeon]